MQPTAPPFTTQDITQENVLIDRNCHPRLTDYGLPFRLDDAEGEFHHHDDLQYIAPELLDPSSFCLKKRVTTKESDIYAFGMVAYQVRYYFSLRELKSDLQPRYSQDDNPSPEPNTRS